MIKELRISLHSAARLVYMTNITAQVIFSLLGFLLFSKVCSDIINSISYS